MGSVSIRDRGIAPHRARTAVVAVGGGIAVVGLAGAVDAAFGYGNFMFAWVLHFLLMGWMSAVVDTVQPRLRGSWFRVRDWEPVVHRRLGAWWYMRLLRLVGWERLTGRNSAFTGTRGSLAAFDRQTRLSEFAHFVIAVLVTAISVAAAAFGAWDAAAWMFSLNFVLHVYPVLLQRALRARIQRLVLN